MLNGLQAAYNTEGSLQYLSYSDVASAVDRVYLQDSAVPNNSDTTLVFLGMDERQKEESVAYWALDITPKGTYEQEYTKLIQGSQKKKKKREREREHIFIKSFINRIRVKRI